MRMRSWSSVHRSIRWVAVVVAAASCTSEKEVSAPPLILITLDTFRQDSLGCTGNPEVRTPHLDRLERSGTHWTEAVSPIPQTTPSHATILSGLPPRSHGVLKNRMRLPQEVTTFPEILERRGFQTAAIVSNGTVLGVELALDQGFDSYETLRSGQKASGLGERTTRLALEWIRTLFAQENSFLWVHYFDTHLAYSPPPPFDQLYDRSYDGPLKSLPHRRIQAIRTLLADESISLRDIRFVRASYAAEVTFLDRCVGGLIRGTALSPAGESVRFLVTADHGESLHEHGYVGHWNQLYEASLRVPCLLSGNGVARGRLVREPVRTVDLAPTVLSLCGVDPGPEMIGRDLLQDPPPRAGVRPLLAEGHPTKSRATSAVYALRTEELKVVWWEGQQRWEFYDLGRDPGELADLSVGGNETRFRELTERLERTLGEDPLGELKTIDDERGDPHGKAAEEMRALGYVD